MNADSSDAQPEPSAEPAEQNPAQPKPNIRLDHFLQACGVETGGQAKLLIQAGEILVNGEVETRRRKKLFEGDEVEFNGDVFIVSAE